MSLFKTAADLIAEGKSSEAFDLILKGEVVEDSRDFIANQLGRDVPWWDRADIQPAGSRMSTEPDSWIGHSLLKKAIEGGPPVHNSEWAGQLVVPGKHLVQACEKVLGLRPVWVRGSSILFASEETMLKIWFTGRDKNASAEMVTSSAKLMKHASQLFDRCLTHESAKKGHVFTLVATMHGYRVAQLGTAGNPIERGNYSPETLKAYDHIAQELNAEDPDGRLSILAGEPGTGKTYLIRSLLGECPKAAFIVVPPQMVENLGSPEMLPALVNARDMMDGPMVLILEDGDSCLVARKKLGETAADKTSNMNAISSLLNLGDGILGSVLDLRIVATTNAEEIDLDPAIQRPGRLSIYAKVDALPPNVAAAALSRLTGQKVAFDKSATIAEVYKRAREMGWKPDTKKKKAEKQKQLRLDILT